MQEKDLKDQLSATRRLLQLASEKRKALERRVSLLREMNNPGVGREPFFYSAIDSDEEPGIVISQDFDPSNFLGSDNRQRFTGFIKINDDAPFIWTHVGVALRLLYDTSPASNTLAEQEEADLEGVFKTATDFGADANLEIGFVDSSSGRNLMQSKIDTDDVVFQGEDGLFPVSLFDMNKGIDVAVGLGAGNDVPGHGPMGLYQLPAEVELPTSGAVEVIIKASRVPGSASLGLNNPRYRAYVTFGGYKIRA